STCCRERITVGDPGPGGTAGHVPERGIAGPTQSCSARSQPTELILVDGGDLGKIGGGARCHEARVVVRIFLSAPLPIGFKAKDPGGGLPVVADLTAADEAEGR